MHVENTTLVFIAAIPKPRTFSLQDPYFQLKLLDKAGKPVGEIIKTSVLTDAGGNATFNQKFTLEKRGSRRLF